MLPSRAGAWHLPDLAPLWCGPKNIWSHTYLALPPLSSPPPPISPLCPPLAFSSSPTAHQHDPQHSAIQRQITQQSSSVEQQSWSQLCIHQAPEQLYCAAKKSNSNSVTMQRKGLFMQQGNINTFREPKCVPIAPAWRVENCQVPKAGVECLVRFILFTI